MMPPLRLGSAPLDTLFMFALGRATHARQIQLRAPLDLETSLTPEWADRAMLCSSYGYSIEVCCYDVQRKQCRQRLLGNERTTQELSTG